MRSGVSKVKLLASSARESLNEASFVIVVPVFFVYQYLVQFGYILPFLGGYITVGCLLASPFIFLSALIDRRQARKNGRLVELGYMIFLALVVIISLLNFALDADVNIVRANLLGVFRSIIIYFMVKYFFDKSSRSRRWVLYFFAVYSLLVLVGSTDGAYVVRGVEISGEIFQVDYQSTAAFFVLLLIYISPSENFSLRCCLYLVSILVLFLVGARSEMVGCLLVIMMIEFVLAGSSVNYILVGSGFFSAASIIGVYLYKNFADNRIFGLFSMGDDASANARANLTDNALKTISENPLLGDFGSYQFGHYAHNVLSVWVDFGVVMFVYFSVLMLSMGCVLFVSYKKYKFNVVYARAVASCAMVFLMLVFAKNYMYLMTPAAIALYVLWRDELKVRSQ